MISFIITKENHNLNLLQAISKHYPFIAYSTLHRLLRKKQIKVNNEKLLENIPVKAGDSIKVYYDFKLDIKYEDDFILVVNKPAQLEVIDISSDVTLHSLVCSYLNNFFAYPCHRLDRNTQGLVLFAKNKEALDILETKFKSHEIEKLYRCNVIGKMPKNEDTLNDFLFKDRKKSLVYISNSPKVGYLPIITHYKVLSSNGETSTLEVKLITGRTHQIRAHLAFIGHPIIGDGKYGNNDINKKFKKRFQDLIAYKLNFNFTKDSGILNYLNNMTITL